MARGNIASATWKRRQGQASRGVAHSSDDAVPEVFKELLESEPLPHPSSSRSTKRRRVGSKAIISSEKLAETVQPLAAPQDSYVEAQANRPVQTTFDSEDDSEEDNFEWEDVNLDTLIPEPTPSVDAIPDSLSIVISAGTKLPTPSKRKTRKPPTNAERKMRLDIHKVHILCLLYHCLIRNHWCNDIQLQQSLRHMVAIPGKIVSNLHPDVSASQFQRSRVFKEAVEELSNSWRASFKIMSSGMRRAHWKGPEDASVIEEPSEAFVDVTEFRERAQFCEGSADYGAQLFCSLLRALGVETRLACSLQILPFSSAAMIQTSIKDFGKKTIYLDDKEVPNMESETASPVINNQSSPPRRIGRLGQHHNHFEEKPAQNLARQSRRSLRNVPRPRHPIFWVEVFDKAYQKWIPVDPLATGSLGKPTSLEPGQNDAANLMSYVIAYEESGVAKDVTKRYAKAYIAKTRKLRVEVSERGEHWLSRAMKLFKRGRILDRDQVEDSQLLQREISEGMPRNIEDFKGHPIYILERHLRRDEVIHPKREVGKVNTGSKSNIDAKIESVYRRQDVHIVKSMDKWFRLGRQVRTSEMPLKRVRPRLQRAQKDDSEGMAEVNDATGETIGLYAAYQTELYVPPAVRNGRIEKNPFGNIDIYVRTMIPRGAVHIKSKYARQAARIIGVDFADAVTGFRFKSMHGTAVIDGVVVAKEYKEAMVTLLEGLAYAQEQAIQQQRTSEGLALWNRFLVGLRIVERVKTYRHEDEETDEDEDEEVALQEFAKGMQQYQDRHFEYTDGEVVEVIEAPSVEYNSQMSVDNEDNEQKKEEENVKEEKAQQEIEQQYESAFESQTDGDAEASMQKAHIDQGDGCGERLHEEEQTYSDEQSAGDNEDHNETWEQQSIMMGEDPEDEDAEPEWLDC